MDLFVRQRGYKRAVWSLELLQLQVRIDAFQDGSDLIAIATAIWRVLAKSVNLRPERF